MRQNNRAYRNGLHQIERLNGYELLVIAATRDILKEYSKGRVTFRRLKQFLTDDSIFVEAFGSDVGQYILDNLDDVDLGDNYYAITKRAAATKHA